jgi:hypothetical protein
MDPLKVNYDLLYRNNFKSLHSTVSCFFLLNVTSLLLKENLYDVLEKAVPNFSTLNDEQKYLYILSSEELSILNLVAKFIKENI